MTAVIFPGGSFTTRPAFTRPNPWSLTWVLVVVVAGFGLPADVSPSLLLALGVVAGLPHGAADVDEGRCAFRSFGARWWQPFLIGYLGLVGCVLAMWWMDPSVMLAAFLTLSIIHFGMQDEHGARRSWVSVLAHGGAPIVVPAILHRSEVERVFVILAGDHAGAITALIAGPLALAWVVAVVLTMIETERTTGRSWPRSADLSLVVLLFALAAPLVAFAFYFALVHTPRSLVAQQRARPESALSLKRMILLTALACMLGAGIFVATPALTFGSNIVRTAFMLLAALTVPHMALDYMHLRNRTTWIK